MWRGKACFPTAITFRRLGKNRVTKKKNWYDVNGAKLKETVTDLNRTNHFLILWAKNIGAWLNARGATVTGTVLAATEVWSGHPCLIVLKLFLFIFPCQTLKDAVNEVRVDVINQRSINAIVYIQDPSPPPPPTPNATINWNTHICSDIDSSSRIRCNNINSNNFATIIVVNVDTTTINTSINTTTTTPNNKNIIIIICKKS